MREEHILGQVLDGAIRALPWSNYRPKEHPDAMLLVHWKTAERVLMPLSDGKGGALFLELTERLDTAVRVGPFIIMRDKPDRSRRRGQRVGSVDVRLPWVTQSGDLTYFRSTVRKIMNAAGIPPDITFASFRHGGLTEAADADLTDRQMMALSGHRTADILDIYTNAPWLSVSQQRLRGGNTEEQSRHVCRNESGFFVGMKRSGYV